MFRALYAFKKTHQTSLGFDENEEFMELPGASEDKNWYYVINKEGQAGYIPRNYVEKRNGISAEDYKKKAEAVKEKVKLLSAIGNREKGELLAKIDRSRINYEKTLPTPAAYLVDVTAISKPANAQAATSGSSSRSSTPPKSLKKRAAPKPPAINSVKSSNNSSREVSPASSSSSSKQRSSMPDDVDAIQTVAEHNMKQVQKQ